jgi:N6-adenosine-specific RNA methylase IME4/ParB-like chromosome segregation protein Spo0J
MDTVNRTLVSIGISLDHERHRMLRPDNVDAIAESMKAQGQLQPIVVRERPGGRGYWLIAGRHRLEAAKKLKWETIRCEVLDGLSADQAELAEIDENLIRAELTPAEMAMHTVRRKELYEKIHPATKQGGAPGKAGGGKKAKAANLATFAKETAKTTGQSDRKVRRDAGRGKNVKVLADVVGTCLDQGKELDALAKLPEAEQHDLAARAKAGEKVSASTKVKQVKRIEREQMLATKQRALPQKKYGVIGADPEWKFKPRSEAGMDRSADNHFPTSELEKIKARDVPSIAADDCVLFLWATIPMLPQALEVMKVWGFKYVSGCCWAKNHAGTGYWFRNRHELLLVGTRGNVPAPAPGTQWDSLIEAPVGEHSVKPDWWLELIEAYFPTLPKIELNRRGPARPGWDAWGNEVESAQGDSFDDNDDVVDLAEVRRAADRRTVTTGLMKMLDLLERDDVDPTDQAAFIVANFDRDIAGEMISIARMNRALKALIPVLKAIHR